MFTIVIPKPTAQQIRAAILLGCFSLNMMVSFACTLHLDITDHLISLFTGKHSCHSHHKNKSGVTGMHENHACSDIHLKNQSGNTKEECCTDSVIQFDKLDKSVKQEQLNKIQLFLPAPSGIACWLIIDHYYSIKTSSEYNPDFFHPPAPDIRLLISRFQI